MRWGWVSVPVVSFLIGAALVLASDERDGLGALAELRDQVAAARERTERLSGEKRRLALEIQRLREDEFSIEAAARSDLGMVRSGEIVVKLNPGSDR